MTSSLFELSDNNGVLGQVAGDWRIVVGDITLGVHVPFDVQQEAAVSVLEP
jgi:hypothetical protein